MPKRRLTADPYSEREAARYENPIASRELIQSVIMSENQPISLQTLAKTLSIKEPEHLQALQFRVSAMVRDCQLVAKGDTYLSADYLESVTGSLCFDGKGRVMILPDDGGELVFLYPNEVRDLYEGDVISVNINRYDHNNHPHGALVEVLEAVTPTLVGRLDQYAIPPIVIPLDVKHEPVTLSHRPGKAKHGMLVVVSINRQQSEQNHLIGEVTKVLGNANQAGIFTEIALNRYDIPHEWPAKVIRHTEYIQEEPSEQDKTNRLDLRHLPLVTIDGEDAKDFDDAVYAAPSKKGFRLLVAIADVSHYVKQSSPLDQEAYVRGNSVYFPDQVIPMLPEVLSNGLCSLKPGVDRLCLVADMNIDKNGDLISAQFAEAVMHSHARLTYQEVTRLLEGNQVLRKRHENLLQPLEDLDSLYQVLCQARERRGAIGFETTESYILLDAEKKVERIQPRNRTIAHKIIEECMLAANVAAAQFLNKKKYPALFRVHEGPTTDKLTNLRLQLNEYQLSLGGGDEPTPKHFNELLAKIQELPNAEQLQTVLLRSLTQAIYSPDNQGHFGLAYDQYLHFTSPIRRYPDLMTHRAIKAVLQGEKLKKQHKEELHSELLRIGEHCSYTERRADDATRDVTQSYKCQLLEGREQEEFVATVSHVAQFGLFVTIAEAAVEGLLHVRQLGKEYFKYDDISHRMIGEASGIVYQNGDVITVRLEAVDALAGKLELSLATEASQVHSDRPTKQDKKRKKSARKSKKRRR